ncbi:recombinase family protein [Haloarcula amylolytica]|uniref:recombinase family protein n=1 Tax=Haloarcula amylolytica TaxID=396317 RepID=UPI003C73B176
MLATYCRVSTERQSLSRQVKRTIEYATNRLGANLDGAVTPTEISQHAKAGSLDVPAEFGNVRIYLDKSTGTNTDRQGFREMMSDARDGDLDAVIVNSVSRLARSIRDLEDVADELVEERSTSLHIIDEGFALKPDEEDPYQRAMFQLLGVFAELEAEMTRKRIQEGIRTRMENEDYHHGPAPLGFNKNDGHLIEAANFDRVRTTLELVQNDELSKRKAARELDTSRRTINRALDRADLYRLER